MPNKDKQKKDFCIYKCKAWCCRNLVFYYDGLDNKDDLIKFFSLRNLTYDPETKIVIVPNRCKWISSHNKCKFYSRRPDICRAYICDKLKNLEPLHYIL